MTQLAEVTHRFGPAVASNESDRPVHNLIGERRGPC